MPILKAYWLQGEWEWTGKAWVQIRWREQGLYSGEAFRFVCSMKRMLQWWGELGNRGAAAVHLASLKKNPKCKVVREKKKALSASRKLYSFISKIEENLSFNTGRKESDGKGVSPAWHEHYYQEISQEAKLRAVSGAYCSGFLLALTAVVPL